MKNKILKNNINEKGGFTILETLVAIFILVLSLTGPMVFAQSGLRTSRLARDQITAFLLAQDAIETIKNVRDLNSKTGQDWLEGLGYCLGSCSIDTTGTAPDIDDCSGEVDRVCPKLKFLGISTTSDAGHYGHNNGGSIGSPVDSIFRRTIYIEEIEDDREARIIVRIDFENQALTETRTITVHENIFNWIPELI